MMGIVSIASKEMAEIASAETKSISIREAEELPEKIGDGSEADELPDKVDLMIVTSSQETEKYKLIYNVADTGGVGNYEVPNVENETVDLKIIYQPNSVFVINGNSYETDDNGMVFKINGVELVPDIEYTIDGVTYVTDGNGRIISCDGDPKQTPEGVRDTKAQEQAGGEDRKEGDQGGHILARILGGSKGIENMLAMRGPINQGPYHTMEKEIDKALSEEKDVHIHVDIKYDGDSKRPSLIIVTHSIDGKETIIEYDNDAGSTELLDSVEKIVDSVQYDDLKQEIKDANEDGANMSIIAVKIEYSEDKNVSKITVIMRDESTGGPNEKRVLLPKEGE